MFATEPFFGIGKPGEEPVEPAERQRACGLCYGKLFGRNIRIGGKGMEGLHAGMCSKVQNTAQLL
jgi:hypothetical protein